MYKIGKKLTDDGIWKDYCGAKLKIGRAGSTEFLKAQEAAERPYRKKIDKGTLSSTIKREINLKALAESILLDWKDVADEDGKAVKYTTELGFEALEADGELLEFVMDIALENDNFRNEQIEKDAKK